VQGILSAVCNLGMDRLNLTLAAVPLRLGQLGLQIAIEPGLCQLNVL
jgi:hypothetical protein